MNCSTCGTDNRENARFCDNCGTPLTPAQPAASTTEARWGIFLPWCGAWSLKDWYAPTADDALSVYNGKGAWYRGDNAELGDLYKDLYLGCVSNEQDGGSDYTSRLTVTEWYKVVWSAEDGGKWVKGDAVPAPDGGRITMTSLE